MTTRTLLAAIAAASALTLGLTACGGDDGQDHEAGTTRLIPTLNADSGESATTEGVAYGGFDTPREQGAATTAYACQIMPDEDPALVYKRAYYTILDNIVLETTFAPDPVAKAPLVRQVNMAANGVLEATCDEASPYYETWVKVGYAQWVQGVEQPTRVEIEHSGALDTEQYAREASGEARSVINNP